VPYEVSCIRLTESRKRFILPATVEDGPELDDRSCAQLELSPQLQRGTPGPWAYRLLRSARANTTEGHGRSLIAYGLRLRRARTRICRARRFRVIIGSA
jgi:hypothetical protein